MTLLLLQVDVPRCAKHKTTCPDGSRFDGEYNGTGKPVADKKDDIMIELLENCWKKKSTEAAKTGRLLSLDGGGIRGLLLIVMLIFIENKAGRRIKELFEVVSR